LRDCGETEVGGFGISAQDDPLLVEDVHLVRQECTPVSVAFDDEAVADFFDQQVDLGRQPENFARCWIHTHPGDSARPSRVDEKTFVRCFGRASWAVIFILAQEGQTYARLRFNVGPGGAMEIPVEVDYQAPFAATDHQAWEAEYCQNVMAVGAYADHLLQERWSLTDQDDRDFDDFLDVWSEYVGSDDFALGPERYADDDIGD
jgi:proteasome lid subunit RPN8/RPN11